MKRTFSNLIKLRKRFYRGFNLVELLVAMLIFVTCLLFIFGMFPTFLHSVNLSKYHFLANQYATQEMEYVKSLPWTQLQSIEDNGGEFRQQQITTTLNGNQDVITFYSEIQVEDYIEDSDTVKNVKYVRLRVKWKFGSGAVGKEYRFIDLETLVYNQ